MKKLLCCTLLAFTGSISAQVEGYKDVYINPDKDIIVHNILCGKNLNNFNQLKPAYIFANTKAIEKGTYYFKSAFGEYSYTFKPNEKMPENIYVRGLLKNGQTQKSQMTLDLCIVKASTNFPAGLNAKLSQKTTQVSDPNWSLYTGLIGAPAIAKGVYK